MCCVACCSSTETAGAAQTEDKRHSQLSRSARSHFHQTKPSLRQLLQLLNTWNKQQWSTPNSLQQLLQTPVSVFERERLFWRRLDLDYGYISRDNTLALIATEICALLEERIRTLLLLCGKVQSSSILVPDVWLTNQAHGSACHQLRSGLINLFCACLWVSK